MNNFIKPLLSFLFLSGIAVSVNASPFWSKDVSEETIAESQTLYNDSVDVTYLESITVNAQRDWVGVKVMKKGDVCFEVKQEVKVDSKKDPFGDYVGASALPKEVDVGKLSRQLKVVDCSKYEVATKTIQF